LTRVGTASSATAALVIKTDFFQDVHGELERALLALGVNLPDTTCEGHLNGKVRLLCTELLHQLRRRIPPTPRTVLWSNELRGRPWVGSEQMDVDRVAAELKRGLDVTPRLSRSVRKSVRETVQDGSYDGLLTDWGIHHLHVGSKVEQDGFVERGNALLFVFVKDDAVHLLDLRDHKSFTNHQLFQIIHDNWPAAIAEWRAPGAVPGSLSPKHDPSWRRRTRERLNVGTEAADGTIYLPPGGGVMLSGHSSEADHQACAVLNLVHPADVWAREHEPWIRECIRKHAPAEPAAALDLRFELEATLALRKAVVSERSTRIRFVGVPPGPDGVVKVGVPRGQAQPTR
jgi:hypothetical protein